MGEKQGHTPGPWKACGTIYEHMNAEIRSGAKGQGQGLAQVWDAPNAFKDALLMAASPDLLEALKPFAEAAAYFDSEDRNSALAGVAGITAGHLRAARSAISRATGEDSPANEGEGAS